jgi:hypothetical protein
LAAAAVVAVVVYRLAITFLMNNSRSDNRDFNSWGLIIVSTTAACINLVFIFFFNWVKARFNSVFKVRNRGNVTDFEFLSLVVYIFGRILN